MQKYYEIEEAIAEEGWPEEQALRSYPGVATTIRVINWPTPSDGPPRA
jgi:hypothetical protein